MKNYNFCQGYVNNIFGKWDRDNSGILERQELKDWLRQQIKEKPLQKNVVKHEFDELLKDADGNHDGKLDRWELYQHCLKHHNETEE